MSKIYESSSYNIDSVFRMHLSRPPHLPFGDSSPPMIRPNQFVELSPSSPCTRDHLLERDEPNWYRFLRHCQDAEVQQGIVETVLAVLLGSLTGRPQVQQPPTVELSTGRPPYDISEYHHPRRLRAPPTDKAIRKRRRERKFALQSLKSFRVRCLVN